jgi:uncharacterized repeat protein (TIGR01451 family)
LASFFHEEEDEMKKQAFVAMFLCVAVGGAALVLSLAGLGGPLPVSRAHSLSRDAATVNMNAIKIASAETARPGDLITYTIIMYNSDPVEEVDFLMVDVIPEHTSYVTHTIADRIPGDGTVELPGTSVLPGTGTLPIPGTLVFTDFIYMRATLGVRGTVQPPWVTLATLTVRVDRDYGAGRIVNVAQFWVGDGLRYFERKAETVMPGKFYLPLKMKVS